MPALPGHGWRASGCKGAQNRERGAVSGEHEVNIKAIETQYKGYRFRSRLEARWAVFFDSLRLRWEYEPEGFDLGKAGWYLPDFYLPDWGIWLEVKPDIPNDIEVDRFTAFHMARALDETDGGTGGFKASYILCGTPGVPNIELGELYGQWKLVSGSIALHPLMLRGNGENDAGLGLLKLVSPTDKDAEFVCTVEAFAFVDGGRVLDIWPIYIAETQGHPNTMNVIRKYPGTFGSNTKHYLSLRFPQGSITRVYGGRGIVYDNLALRMAYEAARSARFEHGEKPSPTVLAR